jgi:hypothetical protein
VCCFWLGFTAFGSCKNRHLPLAPNISFSAARRPLHE